MSSLISKDQTENIICTMDGERGDFLGPRHGTTPAAVIANKIKLRFFKSSEHINENGDGPYHGFGHLSLFSDPLDMATWSQSELLQSCNFKQRLVLSKLDQMC